MSILGDRIKKERENLNLTREDLAKEIGVSYSAIAMYEQGHREPNNELMLKICEIFDCSMDYLTGKSKFKTKSSELDNYLNNEIKNNLIKDLKALELDKPDLEKAITAFFENYIDISEHPTINIYEMEDSLVYYAYEVIVKYFFKLVNKELTLIVDDSAPFEDAMKQYFEKAEMNAWIKIKEILENIYDLDVLSNLTAEEKVENLMAKLHSNIQYYMCPVYGQISAGQPNWAEECLEGKIPIDPDLMGIINPEEYFFLRVNGESMNKIINNGAFALIHKQDIVDDGEIAVVLVNGYDATLKKFTKQGNMVILEPQSTDESFKTQVYDKNTPIKILGKYAGKMEINK